MLTTTLPDGAVVSRLGFGCGAVMGRVGRSDSLRAMAAAADAGVTVFDVARSYGYGEAEGVVGEFLRGRRDALLISTKFGIEPKARGGWKAALRPAARALLRRVPQARNLLRRQAATELAAAPVLTAVALVASLETSLRELRTDYVDFFFLHDVGVHAVAQNDLFDAMERMRAQGKLRRYGASSSLGVAAAQLRDRPAAVALQLPVNLGNLSAASAIVRGQATQQVAVLANNIYGGVDGVSTSARRIAALQADASLPAQLREKLKSREDATAEVLLPLVLRFAGAHVAIVSMMRARSLDVNVAAVAQEVFSDQDLEALADALNTNQSEQSRSEY